MLMISRCISLLLLAYLCQGSILNDDLHHYGSIKPKDYDKPSSKVDKDILQMVSKMTIPEKIGQMTQVNQGAVLFRNGTLNRAAVENYAKNYHVGSYLNQLSKDGKNFDVMDYAKIIHEIQEITMAANSTFKIPVIYGLDHIHGAHYVANTTIFPHSINLAATFNPGLAYEAASVTAKETRAAGVHWTFAPGLDISINKQWPRFYESFGEDPHLTSIMGIASIRGYQGKYKSDRSKIAACMKHFIGYGASLSGQDRDSTVISERIIHEFFIPGFQAAIDAGVATTMESFVAINGEPVVSSKKFLRDMLRNQMGFNGMLVTDWREIENLNLKHKVVDSHREAVRLAISSTSIDMSMVAHNLGFFDHMVKLVKDKEIPIERLDESVARLLQLKKDLGLLQKNGWKADSKLQKQVLQEKDINIAKDAARESITLLKNDNNALPLDKKIKKVLVIGPAGDNLSYISGGWTIQWQGHSKKDDNQFYNNGVTIIDGMKKAAPKGTKIEFMKGFEADGAEKGMDQVLKKVKDFDAVVVCIGEQTYSEVPGNIHDLTLPQGQINSVEKLSKALGKKPLITVLVEGRPRVLESIHGNSHAILQTYLPGPWGGQAIGEVLFGVTNPSGRLPYTYPKYPGDTALNYWRSINDVWDPLYEFGHGLSYTKFEYHNEKVSDSKNAKVPLLVPGEAPKEISIDITNRGQMDGKETVLMYIQQPFRKVAPPVKLLKGFQKVNVPKGKTVNVKFKVDADLFRYTGLDGAPRKTVDNGRVKVLIGNKEFNFEIKNKH